MKSQELKQFNLPDTPGVYYFTRGGKGPTLSIDSQGRTLGSREEILYIGKATSLKDRVKSYFSRDVLLTRGPKIMKMIDEAERVEYKQTDSVLEALILEVNEIKAYQPIYNSREKDDKSYNFVVITKEEFPRILIERGRNLEASLSKVRPWKTFGPFPNSRELKEALKIVRKIFPFRDAKCKITPKLKHCFNAQIGLCPGPCAGRISKIEYRKIIRNITLFFEGKKDKLIKTLESEMKALAKKHEFEKAEGIKRKIFALNHIQDVALIKQDIEQETRDKIEETKFRIEAYDVAHIYGTNAVGVMTVVDLPAGRQGMGEVNKSQYRKFKIRLDKNDDTKNLKEILSRRLGHPEWRFPNLIVVDGGKGQINAAKKVLEESGLEMIDVVSVVKDERHRAREVLGKPQTTMTNNQIKSILLANAEAHRFAINYHRLLRNKGFRI
jgi:excinuclease ABC subunit C